VFVLTSLLVLCIAGIAFLTYRLVVVSQMMFHIKAKLAEKESSLSKELNKQYEANAELANLKDNVLYDVLTGLPGRQIFEDRFQQTLNQCKRYNMMFAVLILDLDEFEVIKNALGLDASETLFKEVANRLRVGVRQIDTVSRLNAGEFVIILSQIAKAETCAYAARRLLDMVAEPFQIQNQELFLTASIGIALYPMDGDSITLLLKNAENALYQAKSNGCNSYQFYREEMRVISQRTLTLRSNLRSETVYQDFRIYYQPQLNIDTKTIVCMDSSLHWQHHSFGLIPEKEFLHIAENNDAIIAIDEWMLRQVCQQMHQWTEPSSTPLTVSVKISIKQLKHPHFVNKVFQILQETNIEPASLLLEFSEKIFANNLETVEKTLHKLKHLGVQIGINNFGTENMALQNFRRFPVDFLKISPALIQDVTVNKESEAIVKMIVALAASLNRRVIAEGVDSQNQKNLLKEMGCFFMEGSYFSKPILAQEFSEQAKKKIVELADNN
jgi:diguanylate cyclase (GGDEF)-like protein